MTHRNNSLVLNDSIFLAAVLLIIGIFSFATFWKSLSLQAQFLFIPLVSVLLIT